MKVKLVLAAIVLSLGLGAAAIVTATANAWDVNSLPGNCGSSPPISDSTYGWEYRVHCDADSVMLVYGANPPPAAPTNASFQSDLDAFVDAHYTAPAATTADPAPTDTTTTTAAPPDTTTTGATTSGTTATVTVTTTVTTTTTDTTACDLACLNARVGALEKNYTDLAARVDAIRQANDAAWVAFIDALNSGSSTADAALAARSAGLNAIYQLA
jgi:hypothetical protein